MIDKECREVSIKNAAQDLIRIERKCFYGAEPERDRLRKMRELIDDTAQKLIDAPTQEMSDDN